MKFTKLAAYILLIFFLAVITHSTISLFQGKFVQATLMAPLLIIFYVFVVARNNQARKNEQNYSDEDY